MKETTIHPTAIIAPGATLGDEVGVGPYSIIDDDTSIASRCRLLSHVVIRRWTELGGNCAVHAGSVLGGEPQDLGFPEERRTGLRIGDDCLIRENVTVNRASKEGDFTRIGAGCFLMAGSHVAHDCVLGDGVVLANDCLLAGHITVGGHAFFGGGAAVHQFCRIGEGTMVAGYAAITLDVPPFCMVVDRNRLVGLNLVGLKRRGFSREVVSNLKECYRAVYASGSPGKNAEAALNAEMARHEESRRFLEFFLAESSRGFARPERVLKS